MGTDGATREMSKRELMGVSENIGTLLNPPPLNKDPKQGTLNPKPSTLNKKRVPLCW